MSDHGDGTGLAGNDTRNLRKAAGAAGEENIKQEQLTQRRGNLCLVGGFATIALTLLANLGTVVVYRDQPFPNPQAKLFANLAFVTVMVLGASLVTVGWIERMLRGNRARQIAGAAIAYDRGEQTDILLKRHIVDMQEDRREFRQQLDVLMGMIGAIPGRLAAIEAALDRVPAYGEGVIQGITLGRDSATPERQ